MIGIGAYLLAGGADWSHLAMANVGGTCRRRFGRGPLRLWWIHRAMLGALWAYDGWNNVTLVAGEVQNPQRNLPRALIGGMLLIMALYLFVNLAYFYVLSPTEIASISTKSSVATEVAQKFLGPLAISLIAAALLSSSFGTLHTSILTGARVPYAMAKDDLFPRSLSRVSPRTHVPTGALIVQAIWACILVILFSSSFDTLTDYAIFGLWIFYALVTAAVFILRRRLPDAERPYRTWGYPVVPLLLILASAVLLAKPFGTCALMRLTSKSNPSRSGGNQPRRHRSESPVFGVILIALGFPAYWLWSRFAKPDQ